MARTRLSSLVAIAAMACAAAASVAAFTERSWRGVRSWLSDGFDFLVSLIRPAQPDANFKAAWHRIAAKLGLQPTILTEKRRPMVSPRWRLCPST